MPAAPQNPSKGSMAVRLASCLKNVADVLEQSSAVLTRTLSVVTSVASKTRETHNKQLRGTHEALKDKNAELYSAADELYRAFSLAQPTWELLCAGPCGMAACTRAIEEHTGMVAALSTSITAAVELFAVLSSAQEETIKATAHPSRKSASSSNTAPDPNLPATSESMAFNHTHHLPILEAAWDIITNGGLAMTMWPVTWPCAHLTSSSNHAHLTALNHLVHWLLTFTRGDSALWRKLQSSERKAVTRDRLLRTLQPALMHFGWMSHLKGEAVHDAALLLPPGFLSHLCCLMCEGLRYGNLPGSGILDLNRPRSFETSLVGLANALGRCRVECHQALEAVRREEFREPLLCHSVREVASLAVVVCSRADTRSYDESHTMSMCIFVTYSQSLLIETHSSCGSSSETCSTHGSSGGVESKAAGALCKQEPLPRVLTTDLELLDALRVCTLPWTKEFCEGMMVMRSVVGDWESVSAGAVSLQRLACVRVIVRHVTKHTLGWMLLQQRERQGRQLDIVTPLHGVAVTQLRLLMLTILAYVHQMRQGEGGREGRRVLGALILTR